jgi:hypothetical protein
MSALTDADAELLPLALRHNKGFHVATKWYLRGWEPLWYQYVFHQLTVPNTSFIAGIATGKTTGVAASYLMDCLSIPYFRALNTSVTAKQSELPFEMVTSWIEGNPRLEHLVDSISLRPYPQINFKNFSQWVFRTAGRDGRFIRGMEFDRINYDEAGLDVTGETPKVLRGRLRGVRPDGTKRMDRLDVTTSPTSSAWLKERFEKGWKENPTPDPDYMSLRVSTYENTRLTAHTIRLMEAEYSDDMIDVELKGFFPNYGSSTFPIGHLEACTDQSLNDAMEEALRPETGRPKAGYRIEEHPRYGITLFELPFNPAHMYVMAGDPGTDGPPRRNSPCVAVLDVTERPRRLAYFHWVDGRGSYGPFLSSYKYAISKYRPFLKGLDATGTQKAIDELAFENYGIAVDGINFARDKSAMINSLITDVAEHAMCWPVIKGLQRQMGSYCLANDHKIPQDIVMTLAMLSYLARHTPDQNEEEREVQRANYRNRAKRTNRGRRR